jgi:hypothetical protein
MVTTRLCALPWDVPISCGDRLKFFEKPSPDDALCLFLEYARFARVSDADIADIVAEVERTQ